LPAIGVALISLRSFRLILFPKEFIVIPAETVSGLHKVPETVKKNKIQDYQFLKMN
jgi:hypothetical protein